MKTCGGFSKICDEGHVLTYRGGDLGCARQPRPGLNVFFFPLVFQSHDQKSLRNHPLKGPFLVAYQEHAAP